MRTDAEAPPADDPPPTSAVRPSLARGAMVLSLGYGGRTLAYFVLSLVLTRSLGPEGYGRVALFIAITSGAIYLATAWAMPAVPLLVGAGASLRASLVAVLRATWLPVLVAVPVAVGLLGWQLGSTTVGVLAGLVYLVAQVGLQVVFASWQALERMDRVALAQGGERIAAAALVAGLAVAGVLTVRTATGAIAVSCCAVAVLMLLPLRAAHSSSEGSVEVGRADVVARVGPLAVVYVCGLAVANMDVVLLGALADDEAVGRYALAYQVYTLLLQYGSLWTLLVLPRLARASMAEQQAFLRPRPLDASLLLWGGAVLAIAAAAPPLLAPVFGPGFRDAAGPLVVLMIAALPLALHFQAVPIAITQSPALLARISVTGAVINLLLDVVLVPHIGAYGPSVATAVQTIVVTGWLVGHLVGVRQALRHGRTALPLALLVASAAVWPGRAGVIAVCSVAAVVAMLLGILLLRGARGARP